MITLEDNRPWLHLRFPDALRVLSFAPWRPGFVTARGISWREVRDDDLGPDFDVDAWLKHEMPHDHVGFLTSRNVSKHHQANACIEGMEVTAYATVGLSNAETVGKRQNTGCVGTINIAVVVPALSETAQIEALTIVAEARTAAVMTAKIPLAEGIATGTGTDCIAVAAPKGAIRHAGKHTALGEALGHAAHEVVAAGVATWCAKAKR